MHGTHVDGYVGYGFDMVRQVDPSRISSLAQRKRRSEGVSLSSEPFDLLLPPRLPPTIPSTSRRYTNGRRIFDENLSSLRQKPKEGKLSQRRPRRKPDSSLLVPSLCSALYRKLTVMSTEMVLGEGRTTSGEGMLRGGAKVFVGRGRRSSESDTRVGWGEESCRANRRGEWSVAGTAFWGQDLLGVEIRELNVIILLSAMQHTRKTVVTRS